MEQAVDLRLPYLLSLIESAPIGTFVTETNAPIQTAQLKI